MDLYYNIEESPRLSGDTAITLGTFDGLHQGHQILLLHANSTAAKTVVITFSNHPKDIVTTSGAPRLLTSLDHRLSLLKESGIACCLLLEFSHNLSQLTSEEFIRQVRERIPFSHLILGYDACFGHEHDGVPKHLYDLGERYGFCVDYLNPITCDDAIISSGLIRHALAEGDLKKVRVMLGREYSIRGKSIPGRGLGQQIGFPTVNLDIGGLSLPPLGVYAVTGKFNNRKIPGIANLGYAPTMKAELVPLLETHFIDEVIDLPYGSDIDIVIHRFLRPEKTFESIKNLQRQINSDIGQVMAHAHR